MCFVFFVLQLRLVCVETINKLVLDCVPSICVYLCIANMQAVMMELIIVSVLGYVAH